jgi:type VI secretion system secreted protein Hcp
MARSDYFLKIDGITGESQDEKYSGHIEIETFSWGATNTGSAAHGTGQGSGKVHLQDLHITKLACKASPTLFQQCAQGKHIPNAQLIVRKAGGDKPVEYYTIKLKDVLISSFQDGGHGSGGNTIPTEQLSINYSHIEFEYKPQNARGVAEGSVTGKWDVKKNAAT